MKINKVDKLQFIYKGKQIAIKLKFYSYLFNSVPVFISSEIDKYIVMHMIDGSMLVVINNVYLNNCNKEILEIGIFDKLLRYNLDTEQDSIIDAHLTKWFGFSNTIEYIKESIKNKEHMEERIHFIEDYLIYNNKLSIRDRKYIVDSIDFIEINDLEVQ